MKYSVLFMVMLFSFLAKQSVAQDGDTTLKFNKKYIQCENKWIAIINKDSSLTYGFVYIDTHAGLTLDVAGYFKIIDRVFIPSPRENSSMKVRIPLNYNLVAIIPSSRFFELGISEEPGWLRIYKGSDTAKRNYRIGFVYNEWQEYSTALTYLEKAKEIDPSLVGLTTELAFTYNALQHYEKAIVLLKEALGKKEESCYLYKELVYAQMNLGLVNDAKHSAINGIAACNNNNQKAEMAYNIAYQYYKLKDKNQFETWASEATKWGATGSPLMKALADLKIKLDIQ